MDSDTVVTVILFVQSGIEYLDACVQSILDQTHKNLKLFIPVYNTSKEDSILYEVCKVYEEDEEDDISVYDYSDCKSMLQCLRRLKITTPWAAFASIYDVWKPTKLKDQLQFHDHDLIACQPFAPRVLNFTRKNPIQFYGSVLMKTSCLTDIHETTNFYQLFASLWRNDRAIHVLHTNPFLMHLREEKDIEMSPEEKEQVFNRQRGGRTISYELIQFPKNVNKTRDLKERLIIVRRSKRKYIIAEESVALKNSEVYPEELFAIQLDKTVIDYIVVELFRSMGDRIPRDDLDPVLGFYSFVRYGIAKLGLYDPKTIVTAMQNVYDFKNKTILDVTCRTGLLLYEIDGIRCATGFDDAWNVRAWTCISKFIPSYRIEIEECKALTDCKFIENDFDVIFLLFVQEDYPDDWFNICVYCSKCCSTIFMKSEKVVSLFAILGWRSTLVMQYENAYRETSSIFMYQNREITSTSRSA